ncbi:MAG: DsbA family oxidoreductase [Gammaproteobacteria bacterium]|nr:DsbA family oxidoreductase [Gammaproteobacteria bacterium]
MISSSLANLANDHHAEAPATLQVDVIADLICPWCYLGKRRLDDALHAVHGPSQINWYPFQLNPEMPAQGMDFEEYLTTKFGDPQKLVPGLEELTRAGLRQGIRFRFDRLTRVPNTLNAHRLMKLAEPEHTVASHLAEDILRGFFEEGLDIADQDVLAGIGEQHGLAARDIHETLEDDDSRRIVLSQEAHVRQSGVTGVPDFLINKRLLVVGAQSTENLVRVFDRAMFGDESDQPVSDTVH